MNPRLSITALTSAVIWGLGCAGSTNGMSSLGSSRVDMPEDENAPSVAPPPQKRRKVSILEHAQGYRTAQLCEASARNMRYSKPKKGWAMLRACATRDDFTNIDRVLTKPWLADIRKYRKSGAQLVAQIVANRGGNVELDLGICNQAGIQLFGLKDAMANARVFRGRYVLMRGKILEVAPGAKAAKLTLAETSLSAENIKEKVGRSGYLFSRSRAGKELRKGRSRAGLEQDIRTGRGKMTVASRVVSHETNRQIVGWMKGSDPEVKKGNELLFLVRFDQMTKPRPSESGIEDIQVGMGAIVGHFKPLDG